MGAFELLVMRERERETRLRCKTHVNVRIIDQINPPWPSTRHSSHLRQNERDASEALDAPYYFRISWHMTTDACSFARYDENELHAVETCQTRSSRQALRNRISAFRRAGEAVFTANDLSDARA